MRHLIDLTLYLNSQALAVLHLLYGMLVASDPKDGMVPANEAALHETETQTWAWYNGRERGIALTAARHLCSDERLVLVWGEDRGSDELFVDAWIDNAMVWDQPTVDDQTDGIVRASFRCREAGKAARYIESRLTAFAREQERKARRKGNKGKR